MQLQNKTPDQLEKLLQQARADRRRLYDLERELVREILSRGNIDAKIRPVKKPPLTPEQVKQLDTFSRQEHTSQEWIEFVDQLLTANNQPTKGRK